MNNILRKLSFFFHFFKKEKNLIIPFQIAVGFFPLLLIGSEIYLGVEKKMAYSGIINSYLFGFLSNSSTFLVNRYQSGWKPFFYGNLIVFISIFLLISIYFILQGNWEYFNYIYLAAVVGLRNSVSPVFITLGLLKIAFKLEVISFILLLLTFIAMLVFKVDYLLLAYSLYLLPYAFIFFKLFLQSPHWPKFDWKNWPGAYLDPLANGLMLNMPRIFLLNSGIANLSLAMFFTRISFAFIAFSQNIFWFLTNRNLSKEIYYNSFNQLTRFARINLGIISGAAISTFIFYTSDNFFTYTIALILSYVSLIIPMTFLRYRKDPLFRTMFFLLVVLILTFNIVGSLVQLFFILQVLALAISIFILRVGLLKVK